MSFISLLRSQHSIICIYLCFYNLFILVNVKDSINFNSKSYYDNVIKSQVFQ